MFTWEEAGQLRGMLQVLFWLFVIVLLLGAFWLVRQIGWLGPL